MRSKFVAGNWKMFSNIASARSLAAALVQAVGNETRVRVAICPPFPYLAVVADVVRGSKIALGAQNLYPQKEGAFTGEVSPTMLLDVGCQYVILGHSERRHVLGETDAFINQKIHSALTTGLHVIFCVGETLQQRQANETERILDHQMTAGLTGVSAESLSKLTIAYEPVWAIGTGVNATPEQAQQAHRFLRNKLGALYNASKADEITIQYGGSVKPDNAASLLQQPDVDGALVGGASLKAEQFLPIIAAGRG